MRRRFFFLLALVSLAICVATAGLGGRSSSATDRAWRSTAHSSAEMISNAAGIFVLYTGESQDGILYQAAPGYGYTRANAEYSDRAADCVSPSDPGLICYYSFFGFTVAATRGSRVAAGRGFFAYFSPHLDLGIPHWAVVLLSAIVAVIALRLARRHRHTPGHCRHCGYDLRATPDRCPECGMEPTA